MIWYLQKNICKWRRLAVRNGPSHAAASYLTIFGRRVRAGNQQDQMSDVRFSLLSQPVSQHVRFTSSNQSARHKLTAPSLTEPEMKPWRTPHWKHDVIFRFRQLESQQRMWGCEISSKKCNPFFFFLKQALSENKLIFRLDGLYSWPLRK